MPLERAVFKKVKTGFYIYAARKGGILLLYIKYLNSKHDLSYLMKNLDFKR